MTEHPDIITEIRNGVGLITLNRPKALNALNLEVFRVLHTLLPAWATDDRVRMILIQGAGDRAFCAGGDVQSIYDAHQRGDHDFIRELFRLEYTVNYLIATFPKPYVALMDGFVLGGGCGVSVHGSHRIVTERTVLAMPETCIGYFPDIGASHFLSQCPGHIGLYLGLTGARIETADILYAGLADDFIPTSKIEKVRDQIILGDPLEDVIAAHQETTTEAALKINRSEIDKCFAADTLLGVFDQLQKTTTIWAEQSLTLLRFNSPFSLELSYKLLKNKAITIYDSLITDYRISWRLIEMPDFYEGVRAVLVDKDNQPQWQPPSIKTVDADQVAACFSALGPDELILPTD